MTRAQTWQEIATDQASLLPDGFDTRNLEGAGHLTRQEKVALVSLVQAVKAAYDAPPSPALPARATGVVRQGVRLLGAREAALLDDAEECYRRAKAALDAQAAAHAAATQHNAGHISSAQVPVPPDASGEQWAAVGRLAAALAGRP